MTLMDKEPLRRMKTKREMRNEMAKMKDSVSAMTTKEEEITSMVHEIHDLKSLIIATKYNIARASEAHDRDCQRMHEYAQTAGR